MPERNTMLMHHPLAEGLSHRHSRDLFTCMNDTKETAGRRQGSTRSCDQALSPYKHSQIMTIAQLTTFLYRASAVLSHA